MDSWRTEGIERASFSSLFQLFVSRGYSIFAPNFLGSINYGLSFMKIVKGDWGGGSRLDRIEGLIGDFAPTYEGIVPVRYPSDLLEIVSNMVSRLPSALCEEEGVVEPATIVDHIVPHRGDTKLFWNTEGNWQSLCASCHSRKTVKEGQFSNSIK